MWPLLPSNICLALSIWDSNYTYARLRSSYYATDWSFPLCFALDHFYGCIFKFTNLFFHRASSVHLICVFFILEIVFFTSRSSTWILLKISLHCVHIFFYLLEPMDHICNSCFNILVCWFIHLCHFRMWWLALYVNWATGWPPIWLNIILGVSVRVVLDEISIGMRRLSQTERPT